MGVEKSEPSISKEAHFLVDMDWLALQVVALTARKCDSCLGMLVPKDVDVVPNSISLGEP